MKKSERKVLKKKIKILFNWDNTPDHLKTPELKEEFRKTTKELVDLKIIEEDGSFLPDIDPKLEKYITERYM